MIEEFVNLLAAAGIGIPGQSLFAVEMPGEVKQGVLLRYPLDGVPVDPYIPGHYNFDLEAIVRAESFNDGESLASLLMSVMTTNREVDIRDTDGNVKMVIRFVQPRTLPRVFPRMEGNGREWSISFATSVVLK